MHWTRTPLTVAVATLGLIAISAPAHGDEATPADFWSAAADAATATIYQPSARGVREAGLMRMEYAGAGSLSMVCAEQWNVTVGYESRTADVRATILQATPECTGDFGAGDTTGTWRFTAAGRPFRILYEDCIDGRGASDPTPAWSDCPEGQVFYHVDGIMPAASGKRRTLVHLETTGMTRDQIITLVRSLRRVS